ncbi:MAG: methylenetetrahydrofolate reductase, partial [Pirellulaceae bacterium]
MLATVEDLCRFSPDFFTCTYGAGGSTQQRTMQVAAAVKERTGRPVASHLSCVGSTIDQWRAYLAIAEAQGVVFIV